MPFTTDGNLLQLNAGDFDFNVQFEQLFFSIIPSALFIVTSLWRTLSQARKPTVVDAPAFQLVKLGAIAAYVGLELSLLILAALGSFHVTRMFLAASVLKLVAALLMTILSIVDHSRSPRPSVLLNSYLLLSLLLDAAQTRTLFLSSDNKPELTYSSMFCAAMALKAGILLLEAQHKSRWVRWDEKQPQSSPSQHSPEETSGIFSLGVFFWLNRLFLVGYRKIMTADDLFPLDSSLDAQRLHDTFAQHMDHAKLRGDKFGLVKVLVRTLRLPLLLPVAPRLALVVFTLCQPLFTESLLTYLSGPQPLDPSIGYGFIGASLLIYAGIAVSTALTWYFHHRMRTMATSILITETFLKATEMQVGAGSGSGSSSSERSSDNNNTGSTDNNNADNNDNADNAALTLMSTDIERIRLGTSVIHDLWASLLQAGVAAYMLYVRLGVVFVAAVGVVLACFGGLGFLISFTGDSQRSWMAGVQKRVGLTATVIASMKNLKISGLAGTIGDYVQNLRVAELAAGARFRKIVIAAAFLAFIPFLMAPPLTFAFTRTRLDSTAMFTSLSFLTLLTSPLNHIIQAIPEVVSAVACLGRIQTFLECETRHDFRLVLADMRRREQGEKEQEQNEQNEQTEQTEQNSNPIVVENGSFGWEASQRFVLSNVNTAIPRSSLTMVVGPVGSGKSTLCSALLGEIPVCEGRVVLSTCFPHVAFCDQTAFLSNGSIRDNIVGFSPWDPARYAEVIEATALGFDLAALAAGDQTNIGSDGIVLSGGQKQRVSLARALYLQSDLLVLDDVFSGLDADTEEQVFRQVFGPDGLLRRRRATVVLCTHSIRHLPAADHIIALGGGTVTEQGTFDSLMARPGYVQGLGIKGSSSPSDSESGPETAAVPKNAAATVDSEPPCTQTTTLHPTDPSRQTGDKSVYRHYLNSVGWPLIACSLLSGAMWGVFANYPTIWLTYWTDDVSKAHPTKSYAYYAGVYAALQFSGMLSLFLLAVTVLIVSVTRAGTNLHREALQTLIRAPLHFFTATDTGVVTNLFSQDLNLIDTELPNSTLDTYFSTFQALGQAAVMLTASTYLAVSYPLLGLLLYVVQKFYLQTSRQLRLLDLEAKSPLYTHFIDTLKGIVTLRAFGFIPDDVRKNARLINASQRPAYLLLMIQSWLNFVLDVVVMVIAVVLTTLAVRLHSNSSFAGASLFSLMTFGQSLSGIVIFYTKMETSIGAVGRLKAFTENVTPEDRDSEDIVPPESWPQSGEIELNGVSATYSSGQPGSVLDSLALDDIHLTIHAGEKLAICGRTGSGKSSLIALLLRLLEPLPDTADDAMLVDHTPLSRVSRPALRQRIIAVPQEAVFLPDGSSFQANLDPSHASTPAECQAVLEAVGLWTFVQARGGLDEGMSPGTLSAGQRQLLSLGRALLRRRIRERIRERHQQGAADRGVLLLDEVSSSVDQATEQTIQEIIRTEFQGYTVIAVSHRLDMIMDFDRVVVMDTGKIVEVGSPTTLVGEAGTRFGELVRAGGGAAS